MKKAEPGETRSDVREGAEGPGEHVAGRGSGWGGEVETGESMRSG